MAGELPAPMLIAGAVGLDFLNSIATPVDEVVDWISNGEDYLAWLGATGLISAGDLRIIRKSMSPKGLDRAAAGARDLREWFRGFILAQMGRKIRASAMDELQRLNDVLESDEVFWKIVPMKPGQSLDRPSPFEVVQHRRWPSPQSLLLPVAEAIARFVCSADFRYVKPCEGKSCTLLFLDETRRRARRWCSMAVCGNRAKQTEHRKRVREE